MLERKARQVAGGEHFATKAKSKARRASEERERALREREHELLRMERENIEKMLKMEEMEARLMRLEKASPEGGGGGVAPPRAPADDDDDNAGDGYGDDDFEEFEDEEGEGGVDVPWDEEKKAKKGCDQGKKGGGQGAEGDERRRRKPKRGEGGLREPSARQRAAARDRGRDKDKDKDKDRDNKENLGGNERAKQGHKRAPKVSPFIAHQRKFGHIADKEHRKAMAMAVPGLDRSQPIRVKQSHTDVTALGMRGGATMTAEEEEELQVLEFTHMYMYLHMCKHMHIYTPTHGPND